MHDDDPITEWIAALKERDEEAARQIWDAFFTRLVRVAQRKLGANRRAADEEDVAVSVFDTLCRGAGEGRFEALHDRSDLWRLLMRIVGHKAVDRLRHEQRQKRGGGQVRGNSVLARADGAGGNFDEVAGGDVTPEFLAVVAEEHRRLLDILPNAPLQRIAELRLEGYSNEEIAAELGISLRSVERKLQLIRNHWSQEIAG